MRESNHKHMIEPGEKLKPMPSIDHPFARTPAQGTNEILLELEASESLHGAVILHYVKPNGINIRICHNYCIQRGHGKFEVVAFNHFRTRHWIYDGALIYKIKFISMAYPDGTAWPKELQNELVRYFFELGRKIKISSSKKTQPKKIARALNGERVIPSPKKTSRVIKWLIRHGLLKS